MLTSFSRQIEKKEGYKTENASVLYYDLPAHYSGNYKTQERVRFCSILNGEKHVVVDNKEFTYNPDQFIILPSHSNVYMEIPKHTKALVIEISDELIIQTYEQTKSPLRMNVSLDDPVSFLRKDYTDAIYNDLHGINKTFVDHKEDPYLVELSIRRLIYNLLKTDATGNLLSVKAKHPMEQIAHVIQRNVKRQINVGDLAEQVNMSESNFSHAFKKYYGVSPQKYMNAYKIDFAAQMLDTQNVTEVAYELGYQNISSFIKQFKNKYNITPKQYQMRKSMQN